MSKRAALFSGQGSQYSGMGQNLADMFTPAKAVYDCAGDILGYDVLKLDDEKLCSTLYAQPAIFALSMAACAATGGIVAAECVAGHSLGEYAALCHAGAFGLEDGFKIIKARAEAMSGETRGGCAMYAIIGSDEASVVAACEKAGGFVVPVNYNQPSQTVISGEEKAAAVAAKALATAGAKAVKLSVSGAFHTKLMQNAAERFAAEIAGVKFSPAKTPFYSNLTGDLLEISDYPAYFTKHMVSPVLFARQIENMAATGVDTCVEFGPKRTTATLAKKNVKALNVYGVEDAASLEKLKEALA